MRRFLALIAQAGLGHSNASALDWACIRILYGSNMCELADDVARLSGESCSNSWLGRNLLYVMEPGAQARIDRARQERRTAGLSGMRPPIDRDAIERVAAEWRARHARRTDVMANRPLCLADLQQPGVSQSA